MVRVALACCVLGCAGGPRAAVDSAVEERDVGKALDAYDSFRDADGSDIDLLADVAALVLELEARGEDPQHRNAALSQLRIAGNAGLPTLHRIATSDGVSLVRALALQALARRGDRQSKAFLYAMLDEDDPAIVAAAVTAIEPDEETDRLLRYLGDTHPEVRKSAALKLSSVPDDAHVMQALAQVSRVDPEASVRNAAVRALGSFGAAAVPALRERLGDADAQVRLAVVRSLVRADRATAVVLVAPLLATPPSRAGIEAARVIALTGESAEENEARAGLEDARRYLLGALRNAEPTLRSQAAVALVSLQRDEATDMALLEALGHEEDHGVRLGIARALRNRSTGSDEAEVALAELMTGAGMPAVQAAVLLAPSGREDALQRLEGALASDESLLRRVAARALAKDAGRPEAVRTHLRDEDRLVRIHAAGGILAASNE
ncbi:MAG: HEAT repeat domain-containing protein [Myxococcota bacterium]